MSGKRITWVNGLLRLWIVVFLIWIGGVGLVLRPDQNALSYWQVRSALIEIEGKVAEDNSSAQEDTQAREFEIRQAIRLRQELLREKLRRIRGELAVDSVVLFLPSLALLLFGAALYWVAIGFRREDT
mgnify:CR=1 FL=1